MKGKLKKNRILFLIILVISLIELGLIVFLNARYHEIFDIPQITKGMLDLEEHDFKEKQHIMLDGEWEFYPNQWIVTEPSKERMNSEFIRVPAINNPKQKAMFLENNWYTASYKITLLNCSPEVKLVAHIPNIDTAYRIFLEGELVATSGIMSKDPKEVLVTQKAIKNRLRLSQNRTQELVIEVATIIPHAIHYTPILSESGGDYNSAYRSLSWISLQIGILICFTMIYIVIFVKDNKKRPWFYLNCFCIGVFLYILSKGDFYGAINAGITFENYSRYLLAIDLLLWINWTTILMYFIEIRVIQLKRHDKLFLICIHIGMILYCINISIDKIYIYKVLIEILSLVPYFFIVWKVILYTKKNKLQIPTALIAYLLIIKGLIVEVLFLRGIFIINLSVYLPIQFTAFLSIMMYAYVKRSSEAQRRALEVGGLEIRLKEKKAHMMLSEIRPHFLYNVLLTIHGLCRENPDKAEDAIIRFSKYLRANMSSIESRGPIPFAQELNHIENYVQLEKLRFEERITIIYDIKVKDFKVPALTIQPLVENAIKHGICKKIEGGEVILKTYRDRGKYIIEVIDNGIGFSTRLLDENIKDSIGLKNIKTRLEIVLNAKIYIKSCVGEGTHVSVQIPINDEEDINIDESYIDR